MKSFRILYCVFLVSLTLIITGMSTYLGRAFFIENMEDNCAMIADVEVLDLIENIRYGIKLGKSMESYYGMDDTLDEAVLSLNEINSISILNNDYEVLFHTANAELPEDLFLLNREIVETEDEFFSSHRINDDYLMVVSSDISVLNRMKDNALAKMVRFAMLGCFIVVLIQILYMNVIRDNNRVRRYGPLLFAVWILTLGVYTCLANYNSYTVSMNHIEKTISGSFQSDMNRLSSLGIEKENIGEIEEYLSRYTQNIDGIEAIRLTENGKLDFELSRPELNTMVFKYLLQTLLLLFFLLIILGEFKIFVDDNGLMKNPSEETEEAGETEKWGGITNGNKD